MNIPLLVPQPEGGAARQHRVGECELLCRYMEFGLVDCIRLGGLVSLFRGSFLGYVFTYGGQVKGFINEFNLCCYTSC